MTNEDEITSSVLDKSLGKIERETTPLNENIKAPKPAGLGFETIKYPKLVEEPVATTGWGETVASFYRRNDPLYNYAKDVSGAFKGIAELHDENREDFDPIPLLKDYPSYMWESLATTATRGEFYRKATSMQIDQEDQTSMNNATWYTALSAGAVGSASNPFYAIGFQTLAGTNVLKAGLRGAAEAAGTAIIAELATEGVLLSTQEQREIQESMWNIGISGIAGTLLGGLGGAVRSARYPIMKQMIESQLNGETVHFALDKNKKPIGFNIYDSSAGAMRARRIDLHGEQLLGLNSKGQYSAASPFIWFAGKATQNPVIKTLTSRSTYAANFMNGWLEHSMDVVRNVVRGENLPIPVQTKIRRWDEFTHQGNKDVVHAYQEYLGQTPGMTFENIVKGLFSPPEGFMNFQEFSKQLYYPIVTGKQHPNAIVQKNAMKIKQTQFERVTNSLVEVGKLKEGIIPAASEGHVNRMYNVPFMEANPAYTKDFFYKQFEITQGHILEATQTLRNFDENIARLKESLSVTKDEALKEQIKKQLIGLQRLRLKEDKRLYSLMESGYYKKINPGMVVGELGAHTPQQRLQLKNLRKPIKKMKSEMKDMDATLRLAKNERKNANTPELKAQANELVKELEDIIKQQQKKINEYRASLIEKRDAGILPKEFFRGNFLRKPDKGSLAFRSIKTPEDLRLAADSTFDNITGLTEANFLDEALGFGGGGTGENSLKARTNMISDEALYDSGIMITDIRKNIQALNSRGGRIVEITKYLQENGLEQEGKTPLQSLIGNIQSDYKIIEQNQKEHFEKLKEGKSGKELEKIEAQERKEAKKLKKEQRDVQSTISNSFIRIAGTEQVKMKKLQRVARFSNDWANATQLGALATLVLQDIVAPIFRSGPTWFTAGPLSFVGNLMKLEGKNNKLLREQAADLGLGIDVELAYYSQAFNVMTDMDLPLTPFERFSRKLPTVMGMISGATPLSGIAERWAANASATKIARNLRELVAGTISKNDAIQLGVIGLRDKAIAEDLVTNYINKFGENFSGATYLNLNEWDKGLTDPVQIRKARQARELIKNAISKEVGSTNFSGMNPASYPSGLPMNSISNAILPFMGWVFNAQANYMIPLLQRYDPNKVMGFVAMTAMASLSQPLREIAMGKEPNLDPEHLLKMGLLGGGFLGVAGDVFNRVNTSGKIFPSLMVDRYERKGFDLLSPITGLAHTAAKTVGMTLNNEFNKKDLENAIFALPLTKAIEFRYIIKQLIDSLDIPENRAAASGEKEE